MKMKARLWVILASALALALALALVSSVSANQVSRAPRAQECATTSHPEHDWVLTYGVPFPDGRGICMDRNCDGLFEACYPVCDEEATGKLYRR